MVSQEFTAGSLRALDLARQIALQHQAESVSPRFLLVALLNEENRATEMLTAQGITSETCQSLLAEQSMNPASDEAHKAEQAIELDAELQQVLTEASHHAAELGRHVELGTEFLLLGLLKVSGTVSEFLSARGMTSETVSAQIEKLSGFTTAPLEVDLQLELDDHTNSTLFSTYRILDAAANRAREGLRVVEDYVRFTLDDSLLSRELKELRHHFVATCLKLNQQNLLDSRNTLGDVGTSISTKAEGIRQTPVDVLKANLKRLQEALRTMEEWSKSISQETAKEVSPHFEQIRYQSYQLEKVVLKVISSRERLQDASLYLLVTEELCHHGSGPAVREALQAGVKIVQLREKNCDDGRLIEQARRIRDWTREAGALFIMNDRPDIAVAVDADGVHVGQDDFPVDQARRIVGTNKLVGLSTHNIEQARDAVKMGVDYIGVGPTFPTTTKEFHDYAGLDYVRQVAEEITLPWYPIGGVNQKNVTELVAAGASRCAVSSAICSAEKPYEATEQLLAALS